MLRLTRCHSGLDVFAPDGTSSMLAGASPASISAAHWDTGGPGPSCPPRSSARVDRIDTSLPRPTPGPSCATVCHRWPWKRSGTRHTLGPHSISLCEIVVDPYHCSNFIARPILPLVIFVQRPFVVAVGARDAVGTLQTHRNTAQVKHEYSQPGFTENHSRYKSAITISEKP